MSKNIKRMAAMFFVAVMAFCGCNKADRFTVTLNLAGAEHQTVYLCKVVDGEDVLVDSAVVAENKALFSVPDNDPQTLYIIKYNIDDKCGIFSFFTENQNTTITGERDDMPHWAVEGCATMDELMAFHVKCQELYEDRILSAYKDMEMAAMSGDTTKVNEIYAQLQPIIKEYYDYQVEFVRSHSDSYIGHYMLDLIKYELDLDEVKELYDGLTTETSFSRNVKKYIDEGGFQEIASCCEVQ